MAIIGNFSKSGDGFIGTIKTLSLKVKAEIRPTEKLSDKAPDYRVFAGQTELGAAWKKTSTEGREYISVKLDDPTWAAPVYASLLEAEDGKSLNLLWSRRNGD
ncbi:MAG: DUF736 domain-containing protein [Hyphomicrobiales bacterium]|nr:DUF736 domain-containing protein [Hyphomicrobiales bacterium]